MQSLPRPWLGNKGRGKAVRGLLRDRSEDGKDESQPGAIPHSFIVKIWLELASPQKGSPKWHGHITYVLTNERQYLRDLTDIAAFIRQRISGLKAETIILGRIKRWLKH